MANANTDVDGDRIQVDNSSHSKLNSDESRGATWRVDGNGQEMGRNTSINIEENARLDRSMFTFSTADIGLLFSGYSQLEVIHPKLFELLAA